ncbi:hypothetical protein LMG28688_06470 [Paraburkholderia caffeinitolerans]|uniref:DUF2783 domain-containing protein n=1 Tax=Paraburkholderia caffeinitolerans TaxID=1723730 RepID=A0A6J5GU49_9BURK|nr:hypothetical protein LMG28688_06470 [Paraburkholderia caffeinitolerans]
MSQLNASARDRIYTLCARAVSSAGREAESLFLARLTLLLFERVGDEVLCEEAIGTALRDLPTPSLSA